MIKKEFFAYVKAHSYLAKNMMPIAIQRFLGNIFIIIFFFYIGLLIYSANQILAFLVAFFGVFLAWGD